MARISKNTMEALDILKELDAHGNSDDGFLTVRNPDNIGRVMRMVRLLSRDREWYPRLTLSASDDRKVLFIRIKEISRIQKLEQLLERALGAIENEHLYDEIMEVLYNGNGQK